MTRKKNVDFTLRKYKDLCLTVLDSGYTPVTVYSYLTGKQNNDRLIVLRHDIDRKHMNALRMAELESKLGIQSTYYFRFPYTYKPEIIGKIHDWGHEIGYHYEVLSKAKGDYEKAIKMFEQELSEVRKTVDIKTICMHGGPLSKYDNRDLWKRYDFKEFGIVGEAYLSMNDIPYFSDTGRSWSLKTKMRDFLVDKKEGITGDTTDELMELIKENKVDKLYVVVHPERWASRRLEWIASYMTDFVFNAGKKVITLWRRST
jgi:hypothetical protein